MKEIIIAVTIVMCFAVAAFAIVASVKIVVAFKTAKLTIGANEVIAKLNNLHCWCDESAPRLNGSYPDHEQSMYFNAGYTKGFENARNQMLGIAMSAKEKEDEE